MRAIASFLAASLTLAAFAAFPGDSTFLETLAEGGRAEVEAGQLAANKATSDAVRAFGMMMAKDHGAANRKIETIARAKGLSLPTALRPDQVEMMKMLQSQQGARFDQEYLAHQVAAHEKTRELLKSEIASGESADTKALAQELLPTVEAHLEEAYRLTGRDEKAATMPPSGH